MADEQAALLAQIRALSGAIDQRKGSNAQEGSYRERGMGRGRGRGTGISTASSRHRTLILSGSAANGGDESTSASPSSSFTTDNNGTAGSSKDGWVKRKSTHNMSLVSKSAFEKTEPARLAAMAATQSAKAAAMSAKSTPIPTKASGKNKSSVRRGDRMGQVIVDGVVFEFDESGTKLIKKDPQPTSDAPSSPTKTDTPLRTSVDGEKYVRTKTGNLISQSLLEKRREARNKLKRLEEMGKDIGNRQKMRGSSASRSKTGKVLRKRGLCSFYNKTGQCKRGLSCPFTHNPDKVAICPGVLRPSGCVLPLGSCPLSHDKKPERVPHCVHYLRIGSCRNGDECLYTHPVADVQLNTESPICMDFSDLGWCERSESCTQRHTWDCPEFLRRGSCSRKGCKLMHVIRGDNLKPDAEGQDEHDMADDDLFVRDDEAGDAGQKRKRGDGKGEEEEEEEEEEATEGEREQSPTWKAKKTKQFARQQDYISFADEQSLQEDEEGEESGVQSDPDENDDEPESVHSDSSMD